MTQASSTTFQEYGFRPEKILSDLSYSIPCPQPLTLVTSPAAFWTRLRLDFRHFSSSLKLTFLAGLRLEDCDLVSCLVPELAQRLPDRGQSDQAPGRINKYQQNTTATLDLDLDSGQETQSLYFYGLAAIS